LKPESRPATNLDQSCREVIARGLPQGGFAARAGGAARVDATAWAVLALEAAGAGGPLLGPARRYLAAQQLADGRVPIHPDHPEAFWPTPLAMLAWIGQADWAEPLDRAGRFLLAITGKHWERKPGNYLGHDTAIRGWPWIEATHSWIEPTALGILALRSAGLGGHPRVAEAARMILNRQLPGGGWNYGNTLVFGSQLPPMPEATGFALAALAGLASRTQVQASLDYLAGQVSRQRTPQTLGWGLLALGAWGSRPAEARAWIEETLGRQAAFGSYDTMSLGLLVLAAESPAGLAGAA